MPLKMANVGIHTFASSDFSALNTVSAKSTRTLKFFRRCVALLLCITGGMSSVNAAEVYNPENNQLTLQSVDVSGSTYTDVVVTIGSVIGVFGGAPKGLVSTYNPALNQLTIPSVQVNEMTYTNVVVTVGQVLSIDGDATEGDFTATLVVTTSSN